MIFDDPHFFLKNFPPPFHRDRIGPIGQSISFGGVQRQGNDSFKLSKKPSLNLCLSYSISRADNIAYMVYHVPKVFTYWVAVKAFAPDRMFKNIFTLTKDIVSTKYVLHKRTTIEDVEHYMSVYILTKDENVSS